MTDGTVLLPFRTESAPADPVGGRRPRRSHGQRQARGVAVAPHTRALRAEFLRWALVTGRSVDADAAAVATAVLDPMGCEPVVLTDDLLTEVLWIDAALWCDDHAVDLPAEFASTLHALIDFSAAALLVHPRSDTVAHLHAAIEEAGAPTPRHGCRPLPTA